MQQDTVEKVTSFTKLSCPKQARGRSDIKSLRHWLQAALCTVAMSICVLLLAASLNMAEAYVTEEEEAHYILQCRAYAQECAIGLPDMKSCYEVGPDATEAHTAVAWQFPAEAQRHAILQVCIVWQQELSKS